MTEDTSGLYRLTAAASFEVTRGFDCTRKPLFVAADDSELLDDEGVGAGLIEDRVADRCVQALDERDDGDDRRDGDDIAEHGHQRPKLGRPDGAQTRCPPRRGICS